MTERIQYDVIIPIAKKDVDFVHWVIEYIRMNFIDAQSIYIITNYNLFNKLKSVVDRFGCFLIDENKMLDGLSYSTVRDSVVAKNQRPNITGHYFQQFLKMGFALTPFCKEYYLTWDSDTIPLANIAFFNQGHPLFAKKKEYRERYFEVMEKVLGIGRQMDASFIAEHMMFKSSIMREIIDEMSKRASDGNWWKSMVNCTDPSKVDENIISEFEMYGSYCLAKYPDLYGFHDLKAFRHAGMIRGRNINKRILGKLAYDIDLASFEIYDSPFSMERYKVQIRRIRNILSNTNIKDWPKVFGKIIRGESLSK